MSIVIDALNKALKEKQKPPGIFGKYDDTKLSELKISYSKRIKFIVLVNLIIIGFIGIYFMIYFMLSKMHVKTNTEQKIKVIPQTVPDQFIIYKNHLSITNGPQIEINGTFTEKKETFLMIGPDIYKKGDVINGADIIEITEKYARVKYKEKIYEIPM